MTCLRSCESSGDGLRLMTCMADVEHKTKRPHQPLAAGHFNSTPRWYTLLQQLCTKRGDEVRAALPAPVVQLPTRAAGHEFLLLHLSRFLTARGGPTGRRGKVEDTNCVKRHQSIHPVEFYGGKQMTDSQICRVESIFTFILRSEKSQNVRKENNNNKSDLRPLRCIYIPPHLLKCKY